MHECTRLWYSGARMKRSPAGFTIIELLIVVTIIVALAAISVFSFSIWRERTAITEVKNELINGSSALKQEINFNGAYPALNADFQTLYPASTNVTMLYTLRGGGASYCLRATSTAVATVVYYVDSAVSPTPTTTACS